MRFLAPVLAAVLVLACQTTAGSAAPVASLVVLTGTVQLSPAGAATASVARGGDQLRVGDRVATGPGSRAVIRFAGEDLVRLDAGSLAAVTADGLDLQAGEAWARNLAGGALVVTAGGRTFRSTAKGDEFAVQLAGGKALGLAYHGSLSGGRAATGAELTTPWAVLNAVLDLDASPRGPSALGTGELLPGEETSAQQAVAVQPGSTSNLLFTAGWQAGQVELLVLDPDGNISARASGDSPISLRVPSARPGGWEFRLRRLDAPPPAGGDQPNAWFVAVSLRGQ